MIARSMVPLVAVLLYSSLVSCTAFAGSEPTKALAADPVAKGSTPASLIGKTLTGIASVSDGDGLIVEGRAIRLFGIDAPEVLQYCYRKNRSKYRCGQRATVALDELAGGRQVECRVKAVDRYKRAVCVCRANGKDLAAEMAKAGWALAYTRYAEDYVGFEKSAKRAGAGIWVGHFVEPWKFRASRAKNGG